MGYWLVKAFLTPVLRLLFRPFVSGAQNLPPTGGAIIAGNHTTFLDNFMIPLVVPRKVTFWAKSDYFTGRGPKGKLQKMFFSGVGMIPIDRSGGDASANAMRSGLGILSRGEVLGLFPEGTRSPDGRLYRGKTGVARMALEAAVPVVPVGLIGMFELQPVGRRIPRLGRVEVRIGPPLDFSRYAGMERDRFVLRSITDEIMYELMVLSGQEYVDQYATKAKLELEQARAARTAAQAGEVSPAGPAGRPDTALPERRAS